MGDGKFKVFCGTANPALCGRDLLLSGRSARPGRAREISDGETRYQILENVRGADVFVVQPCCNPVDFHLMQLLLMIDAFKRASAWRITPVIPYYPYARQDRKDRPRVAISAKLVADLLETAGSSRVFSLDLHAPQIQGYFNIPVDHLYAAPVLVEYFQRKKRPDDGGFAGRGRRGARAAFCQAHRCAAGDRGQAPHRRERERSDAPDRRCGRAPGAGDRRHHRYGRNAGEDGRSAARAWRDQSFSRPARTRCFPGRPPSAL